MISIRKPRFLEPQPTARNHEVDKRTDPSRTNGMYQIRVDGLLQPGTLVIESSTDLAGWAPVFTNTTPTNVLFYTEPEDSSHLWRFYRAFQFP